MDKFAIIGLLLVSITLLAQSMTYKIKVDELKRQLSETEQQLECRRGDQSTDRSVALLGYPF